MELTHTNKYIGQPLQLLLVHLNPAQYNCLGWHKEPEIVSIFTLETQLAVLLAQQKPYPNTKIKVKNKNNPVIPTVSPS